MEGTLSTADFLALENRGYGYHDDYCCRRHSGAATTGIGLAAGLGGAALVGLFALGWGLNAASKARAVGAMAANGANTAALAALNNNVIANRQAIESSLASERLARETWQAGNQPSIQSYIDVQAQPTAQSTSTAFAEALALAQAINNNNMNSAIGTESFVRVQQYSAPQPCPCPCGCNG